MLSYDVSLRSEFHFVMSIYYFHIKTMFGGLYLQLFVGGLMSYLRYVLVRLYLQLLVGGIMSYLRYVCLFAHSNVQHILCCLFFFVLLAVSLDYPFLFDCPFGIL